MLYHIDKALSACTTNHSGLIVSIYRELESTLSNGLDPDQDRKNVSPDLDPKLFATIIS